MNLHLSRSRVDTEIKNGKIKTLIEQSAPIVDIVTQVDKLINLMN